MIDMQTLFQAVDTLNSEQLAQLRTYVEQLQHQTEQLSDKPRIFDMHPGAIVIDDDFNNPLPDEFWFGEA